MKNRLRFPAFAAGLTLTGVAALAAGCGGSTATTSSGLAAAASSTTPGGGATRSDSATGSDASAAKPVLPKSRLGLFITAASPEGKTPAAYAHVWATILKVELLDADDKPVTVFDAPNAGDGSGFTLDLANLHDAAGPLFAPFATAPLAGGTSYTRVRLTFSHALTLFTTGIATGEMTPFADSLARDTEGRPTLSFALSHARDLGNGKENLVVDFDLAKLTVTDGRALPVVREGDETLASLADPARQEPLVLTGTVSDTAAAKDASSGGATTFLLTTADGRTAYVEQSAATAVFNDSATSSPAVADGSRIQVRGYLAPDSKRLIAGAVKVFTGSDAGSGPSAAIDGPVLRADAASGTLVVSASQVTGLVPTQEAVTVTLSADAVLRSRGGLPLTADAFWDAAAKANGATRLRVEGLYEPVTGALVATRARLEDTSAAPLVAHEADVTGIPASSDEKAGTITVSSPLVAWDGIAAPSSRHSAPVSDDKSGKPSGDAKDAKDTNSAKDGEVKTAQAVALPVTVTAATALSDEKGQYLSSTSFFAALKDGKFAVRVVGVYTKGTLTATRAELRPVPTPATAKTEAASAAIAAVVDVKQAAGAISAATGATSEKATAAVNAGVAAAAAVLSNPSAAAPSDAAKPATAAATSADSPHP